MKKIILIFLVFIVSSCSINYKANIVLKEDSIYSKAITKDVWYTLEYTSENQNIKKHLETKNIQLYLPTNKTTFMALYPNGDGYPLTGVKHGNQNIINLSYKYTDIITLIMNLNEDFSDIVEKTDFYYIMECYDKANIKDTFDKERFAYDFLYSRVTPKSFINIEPWWVNLKKLPKGVYICDNPKIDNLIVSSESSDNLIKLSPGVYNFICDKNDIIVRVYVNDLDEISNDEINSYISISKI